MFKWVRKLLGLPEKAPAPVQHNIIPRILIAPDADIVAECKRRKAEEEKRAQNMRYIERNMRHHAYLIEAGIEARKREERKVQYAEWKKNIEELDAMRARDEARKEQERSYPPLRLVV